MEDIRERILTLIASGLARNEWGRHIDEYADEASQLLAEYDNAMMLDAVGQAVLDGTIWEPR